VLRAVASQSAVTSAAASCRSFFPFFFSYPSTTPERIVHRSSNTYSRLRTRLTFDRCAAETALWGHAAHAADPLPTGPFPAALGKRFALSPFVNLARLERHPKMNIYRYQRTFCLTPGQPFFMFWSISVHTIEPPFSLLGRKLSPIAHMGVESGSEKFSLSMLG
jgi:hypothetical protein